MAGGTGIRRDLRPPAGPWLLIADVTSVHTRRLATALLDRGHVVKIAGFEGPPIDGIEVIRLGIRPAADDKRYPLALPRVASEVRRLRPRIIHAHYLSSYGLMASLAVRLARIQSPLLQTVWGDDVLVTPRNSSLRRRMAKIALSNAAGITGDSTELLEQVELLAPSRPRHRFVFGPPRHLSKAERNEERLIVSARHLLPEMRVDRIISGFLAAGDTLADWQLVIAGDGPRRASLQGQAAGDARIRFVGTLPGSDLQQLFLRAKIVVSVPVSDGTSATLLEALAAGASPLVNDLPANREWVSTSTGAIVSKDAGAQEIAAALADLSRRESTPEASRAAVSAVAWEDEVDRLIEWVSMIDGGRA